LPFLIEQLVLQPRMQPIALTSYL